MLSKNKTHMTIEDFRETDMFKFRFVIQRLSLIKLNSNNQI
jgi:hypothetical protein